MVVDMKEFEDKLDKLAGTITRLFIENSWAWSEENKTPTEVQVRSELSALVNSLINNYENTPAVENHRIRIEYDTNRCKMDFYVKIY